MSDLISRQEAIDVIEKGAYRHTYLDQIVDIIRDLPSAQQWIPCSERLPEEDGQYLITERGAFGDYFYVGIANYGVPCMPMNKGKGRGWYITDSEGDYYCGMNHALAWMPLPEPYKGGISMDDLISRQAAIDACHNYEDGKDAYAYGYVVEERLRTLPSAQPEIIRCKDCEYYELTEWVAHRCNLLGRSVYGNDFCAWAEPYKREQE